MGARGYWSPQAKLITNGKRANLIPYLGNLLNRNLLNQNVRNPARLTSLSFSRERLITHLPILADFPPGEAVHPPKWVNNFSSTLRSSTERLMSKGFSSPSIGRRKLLTTSSKVTVNSPKEKRKVCRAGHQRHTRCLRPLASLKSSRFLEIATAFRILTRSRRPTNSSLESSLSI